MMSTSIVLAILLFNGCGGVNNGENKQEVAKQNVMDKGLTKENYIEQTRYYYTKELISRSVNKQRTFVRKDEKMQQLNHDSLVHHQKDTMYVNSVKSPNQYLHFLKLQYNDREVEVTTDLSKNIVNVTYIDKNKAISETKTYSLETFPLVDINKNEGE